MSTSGGAASRAYHHGDLRQALIAAAVALLEEGTAFSLREAARRAGVSAMAPYRHFADKEALLAAVAEVGFRRLAAQLEAADRAPVPAEALVAQGIAYVRFAIEHPGLFRLMFGSALVDCHDDLAAAGDTAYAIMATRIGSLVKAEHAGDAALRAWAVVHGLASLAIDGQLARQAAEPLVIAERILRLEWSVPTR